MIPTRYGPWSLLVFAIGLLGLVDSIRFYFLHRARQAPLIRAAALLALLSGLYAVFAAQTYSSRTSEAIRFWIALEYAVASYLPYAYFCLIAEFLELGAARLRTGLFLAGTLLGGLVGLTYPGGLFASDFAWHSAVVVGQRFVHYQPGPVAWTLFALAFATLGASLVLLWRHRDWPLPGPVPSLLAVYGICGMLDILTVNGWTRLPYLLEFGFLFVMVVANQWILIDVVNTLRERERLAALRDRILANIGHELRTPLGVALGYVELLEHRAEQADPFTVDALRRTRKSLLEERELIDQLIALARFETEDPQPQPRLIGAVELVNEVFDQLRILAERKHIALLADVAPAASFWADPRWFPLVLRNLVHNAIKYSPNDSAVQVEIFFDEDTSESVLRVTDFGRGIREDELARIFERFTRGEIEAQRDPGGLGIGLSLAREIVQAHGGKIHVWSELGHGSTFEVRLPGPPRRRRGGETAPEA